MKVIVVHEASGRIKSAAFVADDVGYEAASGEQVIEIDSGDIGLNMDRGALESGRLHENAKMIVKDFRVANGKVVKG